MSTYGKHESGELREIPLRMETQTNDFFLEGAMPMILHFFLFSFLLWKMKMKWRDSLSDYTSFRLMRHLI